jgi:tetratricopeptide (TPR) repeat protein
VRPLQLNFYQRAKFANAFTWRLHEIGCDRSVVNDVTRKLVLHLSLGSAGVVSAANAAASMHNFEPRKITARKAKYLLARADQCFAAGAYDEAVGFYQDFISGNPRHVKAINNLGAAFFKLGRNKEAADCFRQAIKRKSNYAEAYANLGNVFRLQGLWRDAEFSLQRALKLKPNHVDARASLGMCQALLGQLAAAKANFEWVLRMSPRQVEALFGMGFIAKAEGRFAEAAAMFERVLEINPKMSNAWGAWANIRTMTVAESDWVKRATETAKSGLTPAEESDLHYAIGKYYDDVKDYGRAFRSYERANELLRTVAGRHAREKHVQLIDDLISGHTKEALAQLANTGSLSTSPVFIVGMPRSGTSLVEQIIASHPIAKGAGELPFWADAVEKHESAIRSGPLSEPIRKQLAEANLRALSSLYPGASRVVDKAPSNFHFLGVIHSVFPKARIIYAQRNPIDTCLSCYFQPFPASLAFCTDLSDLAHYYKQHLRIMKHWRAALPPGTILDVPYEGLIADQAGWTRKILDFLGLEWDERCLDFQNTDRAVLAASDWQVRQKIYRHAVERWHNYKDFIGPLLELKDLK